MILNFYIIKKFILYRGEFIIHMKITKTELQKMIKEAINEALRSRQVNCGKVTLRENYNKYISFDFIDGPSENLYKEVFNEVWKEVSPEYKIVMIVNNFQSGTEPEISGWRGCASRIYFLPEADWNEMFIDGDGLDSVSDSGDGYWDILDNARYFCIDFDLGKGYGCPTASGKPVFKFKRNDVGDAIEKIISTFNNKTSIGLKEDYEPSSGLYIAETTHEDFYEKLFNELWKELSPDYKIAMYVNNYYSGSELEMPDEARLWILPEADWNEIFIQGDGWDVDEGGYETANLLDNEYFVFDLNSECITGVDDVTIDEVDFKQGDYIDAASKIIDLFDSRK